MLRCNQVRVTAIVHDRPATGRKIRALTIVDTLSVCTIGRGPETKQYPQPMCGSFARVIRGPFRGGEVPVQTIG
jgi:hypothetical protein